MSAAQIVKTHCLKAKTLLLLLCCISLGVSIWHIPPTLLMPAGQVCVHEACHKTEVQHSVPAMHLQSMKLVRIEYFDQQNLYACFLLGAF